MGSGSACELVNRAQRESRRPGVEPVGSTFNILGQVLYKGLGLLI